MKEKFSKEFEFDDFDSEMRMRKELKRNSSVD